MPVAEKLSGALALALFFAAGWGLGELLPALGRLRPGVRPAFLYLLGIGWVAGGLYALSHLCGVPLRPPAILLLGAAPAGAALALRAWKAKGRGSRSARSPEPVETAAARNPPPPAERERSRLPRLLALLAAGLVTLALLGEAVTQPLTDWDGRMTWSSKAKYLRAEGTVDAEALRGPQWFVSHTHYPVLLPLAQVAALELAGSDADAAYRPLYVAFLPVFLALVWGGVRSGGSGAAAWWVVLAVSLLPFLTFFPGGGAISAYSDLPLACFYGAALALLLAPKPGPSAGLAAGILLAAAILTKDEGLALAGTALALALLRRPGGSRRPDARGRGLLPLALAAGLALAACALLASWRSAIPLRYHDDYRAMLARQELGSALARIPDLLARIWTETTSARHWGLFGFLAPLVFLAGRRGLRRQRALFLALAGAAPLALGFAAYLITDAPVDLPRMTWNRFLVQGGVPLLTLLGWALGDLLARSRRLPALLGGAAAGRRAR